MAKDKNMRITSPDGDDGGSGIKRMAITLLIIAAILYVGAFFGLKTDGARSLIEGSLSKRLAMTVQIGHTRLALPFGVAMEKVRAGDPAEGLPGFLAEEVRVKLFSGAGVDVQVDGLDLVLGRQDDGSWEPRFFSKLGDIPMGSVSELSAVTEEFRDDVSIDVSGAVLKWVGETGKTYVMMEGVDFQMSPVKLPRRRMHHYDLSVFKYVVEVGGTASGKEIKRVWLADKDADYVEMSAAGDVQGADSVFGTGRMETVDEDR